MAQSGQVGSRIVSVRVRQGLGLRARKDKQELSLDTPFFETMLAHRQAAFNEAVSERLKDEESGESRGTRTRRRPKKSRSSRLHRSMSFMHTPFRLTCPAGPRIVISPMPISVRGHGHSDYLAGTEGRCRDVHGS